jgi:hypothetical protein
MTSSPTTWSLGQGDLGPTILVELPSKESVTRLRDLLLEVAAGRRIDVVDGPDDKLRGFANVELSRTDDPLAKALSHRGSAFIWAGPPSYWRDRAAMVAELLVRQGHQYLADVPDDDAILEVSFGETHRTADGKA